VKEKYTKNIFLSLGSNLGNRQQSISVAISLIREIIGVVERESSPYETQAWGNQNQHDFINQVILLNSNLSPKQVLNSIHTMKPNLEEQGKKSGSRESST